MLQRASVIALLFLASCPVAWSGSSDLEDQPKAQPRLRPQCPPNAEGCLYIKTVGDTDHFFINEPGPYFTSVEGVIYKDMCWNTLEDPARPRFPRRVDFAVVRLEYCASPANTSYAAALEALNVHVQTELYMGRLPAEANISARSLAGLPPSLKVLTMGTFSDVLVLEPGALDRLRANLSLRLIHVRPDRVPRLKQLLLSYTAIESLPTGTLDVELLEIDENNLKTINGSAPRLRVLRLNHAPALVSLVLHDAAPTLMQNGLLEHCSALEVLELKWARAHHIPAHLLRGALKLKNFTYTHGNIKTLPEELFSGLAELQSIDLSQNKLESLPSGVFKHLPGLRVLRLEGNHLDLSDLNAVAPVTTITSLVLSENPLGNLCPNGKQHSNPLALLQNLQELYLARTGTPRVCATWLQDLQALRLLDLSGNNMRSVFCADVTARSNAKDIIVIDLTDNPLGIFNCSQNGRSAAVAPAAKVKLLTDSVKQCNCNCPSVQCVEEAATPFEFPNPRLSSKLRKIKTRAVIKYLVKNNMTSSQIKQELDRTLGKLSPTNATVYKWADLFKNGRESIEDDPTSIDVDKLKTLASSLAYTGKFDEREISDTLAIFMDQIHSATV